MIRSRIAVLMGGPSPEYEISLKSGRGIINALTNRGHRPKPLVIPFELEVCDAGDWTRDALKSLGCDVAFLALHGSFGEDGTVQGICDELEISYTGSDTQASRLGMNKMESRRQFEKVGLSVPDWRAENLTGRQIEAYADELDASLHDDGWDYPIVVKPLAQGSSIGISIVQKRDALTEALVTAAKFDGVVLIERYVAGRELTVAVFGEKPLPVVEIRSTQKFFDYRAKYTSGLTEYIVPAKLTSRIAQSVQIAGLLAHCSLGARHMSRTDIILDEDEIPVILEVNTIPGFTPTSLLPKAASCIGISYEDLCEQLVIMAHPPKSSSRKTECKPKSAGRHGKSALAASVK